MVTVTFATLEENLPKFIEEVLTNNITDPISSTRPSTERFVYKDPPSRLADNYPYIIVELSNFEEEILDEAGDIVVPKDFSLDITVLAKKTTLRNNPKYDRDYYASQVKSVLRDLTNENADGNSINSQCIRFFSFATRKADTFSGDGEIIRIKEISVGGQYYGE